MRLALIVLAALAAGACASSGSSGSDGPERTVQLTVINQYVGTVTAYAVWETSRVRLGDVPPGRTRLFMTPLRATRVSIGLEAIGAPPPGTSAGPQRFGPGGGGDADPSSPYMVSPPIDVVNGDAIEFRLSAAGILTVLRLEAGL
ncbi:MAG: hypothetical protein AB7T31_08000 [Gemmatimonadales bacterium]